jgi:hypothetical protein
MENSAPAPHPTQYISKNVIDMSQVDVKLWKNRVLEGLQALRELQESRKAQLFEAEAEQRSGLDPSIESSPKADIEIDVSKLFIEKYI